MARGSPKIKQMLTDSQLYLYTYRGFNPCSTVFQQFLLLQYRHSPVQTQVAGPACSHPNRTSHMLNKDTFKWYSVSAPNILRAHDNRNIHRSVILLLLIR